MFTMPNHLLTRFPTVSFYLCVFHSS